MAVPGAESFLHLVEDNPNSGRSIFDQIDIRGERDGGLLEAMVPVELIYREDVAVNEAHVKELKDSMILESKDGSTGQLSPLLLAQVPTRDKLYIADGFHRDAAVYELGREQVFATIRPNTSPEELLDLRILTANMHSTVSFARTIEWINDAWASTPWAEKLSSLQSFNLAINNSSGRQIGLTHQEGEEVKAWVRDKSAKWQMSVGGIRSNLATAENADPELVQEARGRAGGRELLAITPAQLKIIAEGLPKRFDEQRMIADIAKANNFTSDLTRAAVKLISETDNPEVAREVVSMTDWRQLHPLKSTKRQRELGQQAQEPTPESPSRDEVLSLRARHDFLMTELQLGVLSLQNLVLRGEYLVPDVADRQRTPRVMVDYGDDRQVDQILNTHDAEPRIEAFVKRMESVIDPMIAQVSQRSSFSERDARVLIYSIIDRVTMDMEEGALQYVGDLHPVMYDRLVVNGVRDEIARGRSVDDALKAKHGPKISALWVGMEPVLESLTSLRPGVRRQLVLEGFMRLNVSATQQVMGVSREDINKLSGALLRRYQPTVPSLEAEQHEATA